MESNGLVIEKNYLNSLSEIISVQNDLIDYVRIKSVEKTALELMPYRPGMELTELFFGMPVKVNIYNTRLGFKVLSGMVSHSSKTVMRVSDIEVIVATDRRQFLRIKTDTTAEVLPWPLSPNEAARPVKVHLEDISLSGIQFSSPVNYRLRDSISLRFTLYDIPMEMICMVQRIVKGNRDSFYYGCLFANLFQEQEEKLHKVLLKLQQGRRARREQDDGSV